MKTLPILIVCLFFTSACNQSKTDPETNDKEYAMSSLDIDDLQKRTFNFFWEQADSANYQILDRYPQRTFSSIASTGFGLSSYIVGVERGFVTRAAAADRVLKTLQVLHNLPQGPEATNVSGYKGFFYHFLTLDKALRFKEVELSTIDTGLLMAGVLSVMSYFDGENETEQRIRTLSDALYRRVEWDWAMNDQGKMSMGWHPERGFLDASWQGYNEAMILLILAMGSPTHPIPAESWQKWTATYQWGEYFDQEHVNFGPLFGHQYSHMFIDFRNIQDDYMRERGIDYFENSKRATYANRSYCIENPAAYAGYSENVWGLTACDGPGNDNKSNPNISFWTYRARGAAQWHVVDDGTLTPTAAGGSVAFAPEICLPALDEMHRLYGDKLYGEYGFKDAFNLTIQYKDGTKGWFDTDYIGIDQGPILIQMENYRSELLWNVMKKNPYIVDGLRKAGFTGGWLNDEQNLK